MPARTAKEITMPARTRTPRPHLPVVGQQVFLKGRITKVDDETGVFPEVTIKLERYDYPITIRWLNPDRDDSIRVDPRKPHRLHT